MSEGVYTHTGPHACRGQIEQLHGMFMVIVEAGMRVEMRVSLDAHLYVSLGHVSRLGPGIPHSQPLWWD